MPYASVSDMIDRFGERELIANTTPEGMPKNGIDQAKVTLALTNASSLIDSYLNRRFATPLATPPNSIADACCRIARYALAQTGASQPTEQMRLDRKDAVEWLTHISRGTVTLDGQTPANESKSWSRISRRQAMQSGGRLW
ncbi:gp436 family protein [Gluconobacter frateurii]|uniref:Mu-like prophage protein gp36 n=1 Tax=Gluconobacter frateurii NRIC 0228 TaxID=1307946 RepID=A0ABQ0Q902_9PROT|nr:DUF1320 domain-containing protein [Gluconobacter frateurii]GBR09503.1 Mu-like prophage protein gp36 [Gluconobacter frateurii NRIC 0228]GLP91942.1 hypothetical protein GCM10007868_30170 [Gluconobacter frateurii]